MADTPTHRTTALVAAATMGVYVLIMAGATTAVTNATAACTQWPVCEGQLVPPETVDLLVAWVHRLLALLVGGLVLAATISSLKDDSTRNVRAALLVGLLLFPIQIALGAVTATLGPSAVSSGLHLGVGVVIFGTYLLALAWILDAQGSDESTTDSTALDSKRLSEQPDIVDEPQTESETGAPGESGILPTLKAYLRLTKPRLMWLLCLVAAAGMALAAGPDLSTVTVVTTLVGGVLAIGASGTFNHVLERDVDRKMQRTADRPLATDTVGVRNAIVFGVLLAASAIGAFLTINVLAAVLGAAAIAYYSVVYTLLLKPNTVQNTVIGGLAGSFPAVIGAAAATNTIGPAALALAGVIFLWTPAHFYNLALAYKDDYARGGFPMMPVVRGEATTRRHILLYLGATLLSAVGLAAVSQVGVLYAITSVVLGAVFLWAVVAMHWNPSRRAALRSFHASNAYLGALLLAIVVDTLAV